MQAEDEDDEGLLLENINMMGAAQISQNKPATQKNANAHFKTEIAFSHVK